MPTALTLSPHLDDAAFSCGGTMARLVAAGWRVVLVTAFTASVPDPTGFALACQQDKGLGPEVDYMALRREEDGRAAEALGIWPPVWLDLPEAPHRGYASVAELFGDTRSEDDAVVLPLTAAMRELAAELEPDLMLAPQAVGGHVDHVQLVRALEKASLSVPVLWWRDVPYGARGAQPAEPFRHRLQTFAELPVVLDAASASAKRAACLAYRSQIGFQFGGANGLDAGLAATGGIERFRAEGHLPVSFDDQPRPAVGAAALLAQNGR